MKLPRILMVLLALCSGAITAAVEIELVRVWPAYRDAASFTSASEYFQGPAAKSELAAQRTSAEDREGYYWLVRTKTDAALTGVTVHLEVTRRGSTKPQLHEFTLNVARGNHAVPFGLTGPDWPDPTEIPVAWRLTLISSDGSALASKTSFLWQDPNT